jgi:hypothetical protein
MKMSGVFVVGFFCVCFCFLEYFTCASETSIYKGRVAGGTCASETSYQNSRKLRSCSNPPCFAHQIQNITYCSIFHIQYFLREKSLTQKDDDKLME